MAKYTEEQLNTCSKEMLITLLLSMQDQMEQLNQNFEKLVEQLSVANNQRYGRSSCKLCLNGMPVPLLRNCYSIFNGTKYR